MIPAFESLVDLLRWRAERHPEHILYTYLQNGELEVGHITYEQADRYARALAQRLLQLAHPGDRALLLYPSSLDYPIAFLACLYAGIVAVPAFPPDPGRAHQSLPRVLSIVRDAGARLILTTKDCLEFAELARSSAPKPENIHCMTTESIDEFDAKFWRRPGHLKDNLAFLQYTSGSTGEPKGVMISHRNLIEHQRLAHPVFGCPEQSITVSWLPFYHDMGLIGSLLYPLYCGGRTILMSPISFLRRPMSWLHTISRYRAGVSTGPNFAYDLCVDKATDQDLDTLDLSCWKLTVCGAEPLRPQTLRRFYKKFSACGFKEETFLPCYGLAESTLMASGANIGDKPEIYYFSATELRNNRATLVSPDHDGAIALVSCGKPMAEHQLQIVDLGQRSVLPNSRVGEIWIRGPSIGCGYWGDEQLSQSAFQAHLQDNPESFFRTGDLGFLFDERLFVCGRIADAIVVDDLVIQPHEIEREVEEIFGDQLSGSCVAFSSNQEPPHDITIAVEVRRNYPTERQRKLANSIRDLVRSSHQVTPHRIIFVPPRQIPKTSSGKLRRHAYRIALSQKNLEILYHWPANYELQPSMHPHC